VAVILELSWPMIASQKAYSLKIAAPASKSKMKLLAQLLVIGNPLLLKIILLIYPKQEIKYH
jgi:hypothetical protein